MEICTFKEITTCIWNYQWVFEILVCIIQYEYEWVYDMTDIYEINIIFGYSYLDILT